MSKESKDFRLGKYLRLVVGNDWRFLSTPAFQFLWGDWRWRSTGVTLRFLGAWASVIYYPDGDSHANMFSYEFYEEDYEDDHEDDEELSKDNIALRDVLQKE